MESHLLQMRGLKQSISQLQFFCCSMSHLLQMRGLKQSTNYLNPTISESHLLQMRGLKLAIKQKRIIASVASFTDAWIETDIERLARQGVPGRIFYRCVD